MIRLLNSTNNVTRQSISAGEIRIPGNKTVNSINPLSINTTTNTLNDSNSLQKCPISAQGSPKSIRSGSNSPFKSSKGIFFPPLAMKNDITHVMEKNVITNENNNLSNLKITNINTDNDIIDKLYENSSPYLRKEKNPEVGRSTGIPTPKKKSYSMSSPSLLSNNTTNIASSSSSSNKHITKSTDTNINKNGYNENIINSDSNLGNNKEETNQFEVPEDSLDDDSYGMFPSFPDSEAVIHQEDMKYFMKRRNSENINHNFENFKANRSGGKNIENSDSNFNSNNDSSSNINHNGSNNDNDANEYYSATSDIPNENPDEDDLKSHVSELSNEEKSVFTNNSSKSNVSGKIKGKKKSTPWRSLKPIVLKPFILIPPTDS